MGIYLGTVLLSTSLYRYILLQYNSAVVVV